MNKIIRIACTRIFSEQAVFVLLAISLFAIAINMQDVQIGFAIIDFAKCDSNKIVKFFFHFS